MRILVTGGAGFIGSHLIDYFLKQGHKIICVDNFFSGRRENIVHHFKNPDFKLIKHDISLPFNYKIDKLDRIYNLACPGSPVHYQFDPVKTINTSVFGTQQMLELARKTGARFLQASTSEVYGDPLKHPQDESYWGNVNPLGQRACYDEGKRVAETLTKDYYLQYGVDARIVRIFNVYGPRMVFNDGRVISNFILQALLNEDITVHGDGEQTRSFCYIDDFIEALVKWMEYETDYQPVNIGNPDERSIINLAKLIREKTESISKIIHLPYEKVPGRLGDVKRRKADITKLQQSISWALKTDFNVGLEKTIEDFKKRLKEKPHIIVFIPAYLPFKGPAEEAVAEIIKRLPGWEFDIITALLDKNLAKEEHHQSVHIYRLGIGSKLDKYLLPLRALKLAKRLHKKNNYRIAWGIMASYGALAACLFSTFSKNVPILLSVYEGDLTEKLAKKGRWLSPIYKLIFRKAHRWQLIAQINEQQRAWLENERYVQVVKFDQDWNLLAKRTKEMFQEIEILSTRI
ncbi:GDP-mannose 4,6-dehydratase [Patescibacteria group bacterium]|nr:GDP-mannose 4,6-dehydratase [Patescibacteria group bacterium]